MSDELLRTTYEWKLAGRGDSRADCPMPEALAAVIDGTATEAERLQTLRHVGSCRHCRSELDLLRATHETAEMAVQPQARRVPMYAAAAAVLLFVVAGVALRDVVFSPAETVRDATPAGAMRLITPADETTAPLPVTLEWATVPNARRYDVEILSADGAAVFTATTRDTTLAVATDAPLTPGAPYRWWVGATMPDGSQVRSLARTLRIAP